MLNKYDCMYLVDIIKHYKESLACGYNMADTVISKEVDLQILKYGIDWCNRLIEYFEQESIK